MIDIELYTTNNTIRQQCSVGEFSDLLRNNISGTTGFIICICNTALSAIRLVDRWSIKVIADDGNNEGYIISQYDVTDIFEVIDNIRLV